MTVPELVQAIEARLAALSDQRHRAAVEADQLTAVLTPLRMGVITPQAAVVVLQTKGVILRLRPSPSRRPTVRELGDPAYTPRPS